MQRPTLHVRRIAGIVLVVSDLARLADFYREALGFETISHSADRAVLELSGQRLELIPSSADARPYPEPSAANDPWFQHFAIRVSDMAAAYDRLACHSFRPISSDGPERLPPSTGSVTAFKFRDPDGHPLELSFVPDGGDRPRRRTSSVALDHTALAVGDLASSIAFYSQDLGFSVGRRFLNRGQEQDRLDGLQSVELDIMVLETTGPGPRIELLHYRTPTSRAASVLLRPGDLAATRTVLEVEESGSAPVPWLGSTAFGGSDDGTLIADPDGHLLEIRRTDRG